MQCRYIKRAIGNTDYHENREMTSSNGKMSLFYNDTKSCYAQVESLCYFGQFKVSLIELNELEIVRNRLAYFVCLNKASLLELRYVN